MAAPAVHSALPDVLAAVVDAALGPGVRHVAHGDGAPLAGAEAAVRDEEAVALIGPYRSADVAEAVEVTAPAGLPLLAPAATWAGVTRDDEPGCDDAARHRGTVLRLPARDTVVAARIAADLRREGRRALVIAGEHDYGRQLDGQLRLAGLERAGAPEDADVVVLCGLADGDEVARARAAEPLPVVAFDGIQGAELGDRDAVVAMAAAPAEGIDDRDALAGAGHARRAAQLVAAAIGEGAAERAQLLSALRRQGPFDEHGDPVDPPVWLWRADAAWRLRPERELSPPA